MSTVIQEGFAPGILREYDIRGIIGQSLSEQDAYLLGRSFASFLAKTLHRELDIHVCVGRDGRLSSPALHEALCHGLQESGVHVHCIGVGPSPMLYFAVRHLDADAGIMVTGSHNPPDYNGFKMTLNPAPVFGKSIQSIGRIAQEQDFITGQGSVIDIDVSEAYIARLLRDYTNGHTLRIAWDAGNGAAGEIMRRLSEKIPGDHFLLYDEIDGRFPNHHPDPTVDRNLEDLRDLVLREGCDLGVAFDGDGDRIGVVDEHGAVIRCDTLLALYAREVLAAHPGATIIGDVKCSQVLYDEIKRLGGQPVMWKTGHSLIKDKMQEMHALLAGELSGHIFFADHYYGYDDALYCAIRLFNALSEAQGGLSSLTADLPKLYNTPEIRIEVDEARKFDLVRQIVERVENMAQQDGTTISTLDGLRVNTAEGWWLLRASNTQNALVVRIESTSQKGLAALHALVSGHMKKIGYTLSAL